MNSRSVMRGTVTEVGTDRGLGFIADGRGQGFIFHRSALQATDFGDLAPGVPVEFEVAREAPGEAPGERPRR